MTRKKKLIIDLNSPITQHINYYNAPRTNIKYICGITSDALLIIKIISNLNCTIFNITKDKIEEIL